jgi:hypothetical protein
MKGCGTYYIRCGQYSETSSHNWIRRWHSAYGRDEHRGIQKAGAQVKPSKEANTRRLSQAEKYLKVRYRVSRAQERHCPCIPQPIKEAEIIYADVALSKFNVLPKTIGGPKTGGITNCVGMEPPEVLTS